MLNKIYILLRSIYGYFLKWGYDLGILSIPSLGEREQANVVVSLTSYDRRVQKGVVCYTIYSLLRQTIHPKRIILWLSQDEWTESTLPKRIVQLKQHGVEIRFCEDMRSYKKLLPTLQLLPDEDIITVDDDVIYPATLIEHLMHTHTLYPNDIIATRMYAPSVTPVQPYRQWNLAPRGTSSMHFFAVGVGGVLYPAHALHPQMLEYALACQYAPLADDVWFWGASIARRTNKRTTEWTFDTDSFDAIYQFLHKGSALQHSNIKGTEITNDTQIAATLTYIHEKHGIS